MNMWKLDDVLQITEKTQMHASLNMGQELHPWITLAGREPRVTVTMKPIGTDRLITKSPSTTSFFSLIHMHIVWLHPPVTLGPIERRGTIYIDHGTRSGMITTDRSAQ